MRAAILREIPATAFEIRDDVELDPPESGEVVIEIARSGVCHSDLSVCNGTFGSAVPLPSVLGHEGAGTVVEVGSSVTGLEEGDHVVLSWVPPCGWCFFCSRGEAHLCSTAMAAQVEPRPRLRVGGERVYASSGTFAERVLVPASAAIRVPESVPLNLAALVGCAVMTGVGAALRTARVEPGSSVVVFGCGGVGLNVIQGCRIAGASDIVAVDLLEDKRNAALRFGATQAVHPSELADVAATTTPSGVGFDYAFEVIGLPETIRSAYDVARRGGTVVVVGAGSPERAVSFNTFELFSSERMIRGCYYGSADVRTDFSRILHFWERGMLDLEGLISQTIDVSELDAAFHALDRGDVIRSVVSFSG